MCAYIIEIGPDKTYEGHFIFRISIFQAPPVYVITLIIR